MKFLASVLAIISGYFLIQSVLTCLGLYSLIDNQDIPIVLYGTMEFYSSIGELNGEIFGCVIIAIISLVLFSWSIGLFRRFNRRNKENSRVQREIIQKPFILYLRSFIDEKETRKILRPLLDLRSEEELLIDVFRDIAPVYAIGDPADKKIPYGAYRVYVEDSIWKQTVESMAKDAEIVVLRLGKTNNFWWEVEMALKYVPIHKVVFVVPWSKSFQNVSTLYKMIRDHREIDISMLNITIDRKRTGSISSVLYFNSNGSPICKEISIPRFTSIFLSYDKLLQNAFSELRLKYGLKSQKKIPVLKSRVLTFLLVIILLGNCGLRFIGNYLLLKYQRPYEIVENCMKDPIFSSKYGTEVNGTNLMWAIIGSAKGQFLLSDDDIIRKFRIEDWTLSQISASESEVLLSEPFNIFLMIKKYESELYDEYVRISTEACLIWEKNPQATIEAWKYYRENVEKLPDWVKEFSNLYSDNEKILSLWRDEVRKHIDDEDIVFVLKVLSAQAMRLDYNSQLEN